MIETRLLHYFLTVAREQNITNAAKALNITQPTLSRQMTFLEHQIGAKLFQRDSRPLVLTDEGILLRHRAEEILKLLEKTEAEVSIREEQIEGTVYIGCGELALGAVVLVNLMTMIHSPIRIYCKPFKFADSFLSARLRRGRHK